MVLLRCVASLLFLRLASALLYLGLLLLIRSLLGGHFKFVEHRLQCAHGSCLVLVRRRRFQLRELGISNTHFASVAANALLLVFLDASAALSLDAPRLIFIVSWHNNASNIIADAFSMAQALQALTRRRAKALPVPRQGPEHIVGHDQRRFVEILGPGRDLLDPTCNKGMLSRDRLRPQNDATDSRGKPSICISVYLSCFTTNAHPKARSRASSEGAAWQAWLCTLQLPRTNRFELLVCTGRELTAWPASGGSATW